MSSKLEYLKKFNKKINIIDSNSAESHNYNIPLKWRYVFKESDFNIQKNKTIEIWESIIKKELRNTILYLFDNLESLDLLYDGQMYSLLYGIKSDKGKILYYEGQFAPDLNKNIELKNRWNDIPKSIRNFYENLHNGFYCYASHSMGLAPEDEVTNFSEYV